MDEMMEWIESAHKGDKEARDRLVMENSGLVWSIVKRFGGRGYESEDLFQIGTIGLIKAIDKFDVSYDVKFSTYAVPLIMGEIRRFLRDDGMIKVSRSLKELDHKARVAMEEMSVTLGRDPTITELSAKLGVETTELAAALESAGQVESLSQTIYRGDGNEICLMDKLEEDRDGEQETVDRMVITQLLEGLEERDRTLIRMRYYEDKTQTQVAKIMGVSQVQISRIEKKILRSMRDKINGT
jgi:RNA polymerase sporulation-specific sigma factor